MIQVVIPTMCLCPKEIFSYTLEQMELSSSVEKVIIIDNTVDKRFKDEYEVGSKVEVIENGKNIYVNPAWNQGLELVTSEHYMILNDDIAVQHYIFNVLNWILETHDEIGILTVKTIENMPLDQYKEKIDKISEMKPDITFTTKMLNPSGIQGWLMVGRTKDWKPIPPELRIWYGDDFIYSRCRRSGKKALNITSYFVDHFVSSTVSTELSPEDSAYITKIIHEEVRLMQRSGKKIMGQ